MKSSNLGLGVAFALAVAACWAGADTDIKGADYAKRLQECNQGARNLCESIECENRNRAAGGRFPREVPTHCRPALIAKDAGNE